MIFEIHFDFDYYAEVQFVLAQSEALAYVDLIL